MANGLIDFNPRFSPSLRSRPRGQITAQGSLPVGYNIPRNLPQLTLSALEQDIPRNLPQLTPPSGGLLTAQQQAISSLNPQQSPMGGQSDTSEVESEPKGFRQRARGILGSIGGFLSDPNVLDTLAIGFGGMSMRPNEALMQQAAARIQQRQELEAMQGYANRTAEYFKSIGRDDLADQVLRFPESSQEFLSTYLQQQKSLGSEGLTDLLSSIDPDLYQLESVNEFVSRYSQTGVADYSLLKPRDEGLQIQEGFRPVVRDGEIVGQLPMPGPAYREAQDAIDKAFFNVQNVRDTGFDVIANIDDALSQLENKPNAITGFWGANLSNVAGTPAYNLNQDLDTIKAALGFAELQAMREASETGGALGNVVVAELQLLQRTIDSIEQGQTPEKLKASLNNIRNQYINVLRKLPPRKLTQEEYFGIDTPDFLRSDYEIPSIQEFDNQYFGPNSQYNRFGATQQGATFSSIPAPNQVPVSPPQQQLLVSPPQQQPGIDPLNPFGI